MKISPLILLALLCALCRMAAAEEAGPFDGNWDVDLSREYDANSGARDYDFQFPAHISKGELFRQRGNQNQPTWLKVEGEVHADGSSLAAGGWSDR